MKKVAYLLFLCAAGIVLFLAVGAWYVLGESVSFETDSISPDGMYKCELREYSTGQQSRAIVKLFKRVDSEEQPWVIFKTEKIYNDSCCRRYYSIDWQYDDNLKPEHLLIFGGFGAPPQDKEPILDVLTGESQSPAEDDDVPGTTKD